MTTTKLEVNTNDYNTITQVSCRIKQYNTVSVSDEHTKRVKIHTLEDYETIIIFIMLFIHMINNDS